MGKLTKRVADAAEAGSTVRFEWDGELRGFGLRVGVSGVKTFVVQYRTDDGRSRRMVLGRYGVLTVDQARQQARQVLADASGGGDAAGERRERRKSETFGEVLDRYLTEHVDVHNAKTTGTEVRRLVENHIRPRIGSIKAGALARKDVAKMHSEMRETPRQANFALSIVSKACSLAELWDLRKENNNPTRGIRRYAENHRERFLTGEELGRLGAALVEAETVGLPWKPAEGEKEPSKHLAKEANRRTRLNPIAIAAIRLLLFTGARLSEIVKLSWAEVHLAEGTIALPGRKGGQRSHHPVSGPVLGFLQTLRETAGSSPWVLPRPNDPERHISKEVLENTWQRVRWRAGIEDVRLHDLRHTVGTYASQAGVNAFVVRDLLRHRDIGMTSRYANRDADPIRAVSEVVGDRILRGLRS